VFQKIHKIILYRINKLIDKNLKVLLQIPIARLIAIASVKVQNKNRIQRKEQQRNRKKMLNFRKKNKNKILNNNYR
jgi:hypothetical protein